MAPSTNRLAVVERGAGRPILFVHGLTFDHRLLHDVSEPVLEAAAWQRLYVDLPGHGDSPADPAAASAEGLVAKLAALVDERCSEPPLVVGHSYGGYLALGLAAVRPIAGLLLVTPVVEPDPLRRRLPARRIVAPTPLVFGSERERATFEDVAVVQTDSVRAAYARLVHTASEATDREALAAIRERYALPYPLLGRIDPALRVHIVCGRDDHWCGYEDQLAVVRALPNAELEIVPHAGQLLPIEASERYRLALTRAVSLLPTAPTVD